MKERGVISLLMTNTKTLHSLILWPNINIKNMGDNTDPCDMPQVRCQSDGSTSLMEILCICLAKETNV